MSTARFCCLPARLVSALLIVLVAALSGGGLIARVAEAGPLDQSAPPGAAAQGEFWVQNFQPTELWSGPDARAVSFGSLRKFSYLKVIRWAEGGRLYVYNPKTDGFAYVDGSVVGRSGPPPADYLDPYQVVARFEQPARIIGKSSLYSDPVADDAVWTRELTHNDPVVAVAEVQSEDSTWYKLDSGEFVQSDDIRLPAPPTGRYTGKWIDADLSMPTMVTAYEGNRPVASALAIQGIAKWPTPVGTFTIFRRVYNETMSSEGLGIPRNAPGGYYVQNVLFTQYFTGDGASLHYNYWSGNFGYQGSHGCLGLNFSDALWFWNWVDYGTPIVVRYSG